VTIIKFDYSLLDQGHAHGHQRRKGSVFIRRLFPKFALVENVAFIINLHHTRTAGPRLAAPRLHTGVVKSDFGQTYAEIIFNLRKNALTQKNNTRTQAKRKLIPLESKKTQRK